MLVGLPPPLPTPPTAVELAASPLSVVVGLLSPPPTAVVVAASCPSVVVGSLLSVKALVSSAFWLLEELPPPWDPAPLEDGIESLVELVRITGESVEEDAIDG